MVSSAGLPTGANHSQPQPNPTLMNTCLITTNVGQLVNFYESVLGIKAQRSGDQYAEFRTGVGVLAIFSAEAQEKYSGLRGCGQQQECYPGIQGR